MSSISIIEEILKSESEKDVDLMTGSYYTPLSTALTIIERLDPDIEDQIFEPSCGSGVFVFSILDYMLKKYQLNPEEALLWFIHNVAAVDIDSKTLYRLKKNVAKYFTEYVGIDANPSDFHNIYYFDGLNIEGEFSIVVGNPPYVNAKHLSESQVTKLKRDYKSCSSARADLYLAFIEHYIKLSERVCLLVPRAFTRNKLSDEFKEMYKNKIKWVEMYNDDLFKDASIYTMSFEYDEGFSSEKVKNSVGGKERILKFDTVFTNFQKVVKSDLVIQGDLATLANKLYNVKKVGENYIATNHMGEIFNVESDMVKIAIKGTKTRAIDGVVQMRDDDYIIFPYLDDNSPVPLDEMIVKYPDTFKYFQSIEGELKKRDRGKAENLEPFYVYGRKQGLGRRNSDMYMLFPKIVGGESQPLLIKKESFDREFFVFSGYTLEVDESFDIKILDGFYDYISAVCQPYKGTKEDYYSISPKVILRYLAQVN